MAKENYRAMRERQQKEFDRLPIHAAFGDKQFQQKLKELGLSDQEGAENYFGTQLVSLGFGAFILKKDLPVYNEVVERHNREQEEAIQADTTGQGFIKDMFIYELDNHEYGYTGDASDTLVGMGISWATLEKRSNLKAGFLSACEEIMSRPD